MHFRAGVGIARGDEAADAVRCLIGGNDVHRSLEVLYRIISRGVLFGIAGTIGNWFVDNVGDLGTQTVCDRGETIWNWSLGCKYPVCACLFPVKVQIAAAITVEVSNQDIVWRAVNGTSRNRIRSLDISAVAT